MEHYYTVAFIYAILVIINLLIIPKSMFNQFNWKKLLIDLVKVAVGAIAGWLGAGTII